MKKRALLIAVTLIAIIFLSISSTQAKTIIEEQADGNFEITWRYSKDLAAGEVYLAGDMNDWSTSHPDWQLEREDGVWQITKEMEPGIYEYKFVVDGEWVLDREADDFADDGMGGENSVARAVVSGWELNQEFLGRRVDSRITFDLKNKFEHLRGRYNFENSLNFALRGSLFSNSQEEVAELINYNSRLKLNPSGADLTNQAEYELELSDYALSTTYLADDFNLGLELNTTDELGSNDFLGLIDTNEEKEEADTLQQEGELRQLNYQSSDLLGVETNLALSDYGGNSRLHYLNLNRELTTDLELGANLISYTPNDYKTGEVIDTAHYSSLFAQYQLVEDLKYNATTKAQLSLLPTGNIDQDIVQINRSAGSWDLEVDLADIISLDSDWSSLDSQDIERVVLIGEFNDWEEDPDYNYQFELKQDVDSQWEVTGLPGPTPEIIGADGYKIMAFDRAGNAYYYPSGLGGELEFAQAKDATELELEGNQLGYLLESEYGLIDEQASLYNRVGAGDFALNEYRGQLTAGLKGVPKDSYLKFANDKTAKDSQTGYHQAYLDGWYRFGYSVEAEVDRSIKLSAATLYKLSQEDEADLDPLNRELTLAADWNNPTKGLNKLYTNLKTDPYQEDKFEAETSELELGLNTDPLAGVELSASTKQYLDAEVSKYQAGVELNSAIKQLDYLRGDLTYLRDDISELELDDEVKKAFSDGTATKFVSEIRLVELPVVKPYFDYLDLSLTLDQDGLIDHENYEDDENYWQNKLTAQTHFDLAELKDWSGLKIDLTAAQVEDHRISKKPAADSENEQFYLSDYNMFIDWYIVSTLETGYKLPLDLQLDLKLKFDHNRVELSQYEADVLLIELSKSFAEQTNVNLSYNRRDEDNGENYFKLMTETIF